MITSRRLALALALVSVLAALSLTACGSSEEPKTSHVSGEWTLEASGGAPKATWKITSACSSGPCDFTANEGLGQKVTFKYDESAGNYVSRSSAKSDCLKADGSVGAKKAVTVSTRSTFTPTEAKKIDGAASATAATVKAQLVSTVSAAGVKAGCPRQDAIPAQTQTATRNDN